MGIKRHWHSHESHAADVARSGAFCGACGRRRVHESRLEARPSELDDEASLSRQRFATVDRDAKLAIILARLRDLWRPLAETQRVFRLDGRSSLTDAEWAALGISPFFAKLRGENGGQGGEAGGSVGPRREAFAGLRGSPVCMCDPRGRLLVKRGGQDGGGGAA